VTRQKGAYGVPPVRGPFVELAPHPLGCRGEAEVVSLAASLRRPLAADLFCGAGGLSLGYHSPDENGPPGHGRHGAP
jgi:DNA (cytosine-5)-methyltransferase 1